MDPLLLRAVTAALDREWAGGRVRRLTPDVAGRLRLELERDGAAGAIAIDLDPRDPWIAAASGRDSGERPARDLGDLPARLKGRRPDAFEHPLLDRWMRIRFSGGESAVVEMTPGRVRLVLLDADGVVCAGWPRNRGDPGASWTPPLPRPGRRVVDVEDPAAIERELAALERGGLPPWEGLLRLLGVTREARDLLRDEIGPADAPTIAAALADRAASLRLGVRVPEGLDRRSSRDVERARGSIPRERSLRLWGEPVADPPRSAARALGALRRGWDRARAAREREARLAAAVDRAERRLRGALDRVRGERERFEAEGDRWKHAAEALLAGWNDARREDGEVRVPDPRSPTEFIAIPDPEGRSFAALADRAFERHRRVVRGRRRSAERLVSLEARLNALSALGARLDPPPETFEALEALEAEGRRLGLVVGLRPLRQERPDDARARRRLPGVRVFCAPSGETVLGGKGARDNDRLTFKIATPDDFWFHAHGTPGAHVVLRNPDRRPRPDARDLAFAAGIAAWFSEQRGAAAADVAWTRRKYVRRLRGAPAGTVKLKKFEVVRVRPALPDDPLLGS